MPPEKAEIKPDYSVTESCIASGKYKSRRGSLYQYLVRLRVVLWSFMRLGTGDWLRRLVTAQSGQNSVRNFAIGRADRLRMDDDGVTVHQECGRHLK